MHPFLTERLATAHLAELHAEADRARLIRLARPATRFRLFRRQARGAPPSLVVIENPHQVAGEVDTSVQSRPGAEPLGEATPWDSAFVSAAKQPRRELEPTERATNPLKPVA